MASKAYSGVTQSIFDCIKTTSLKAHGTTYDPPNADAGTAMTQTAVGAVTLGFALVNGTLTYTIEHKPGIVTDSEIWNGIDSTVNGCQSS